MFILNVKLKKKIGDIENLYIIFLKNLIVELLLK